jgi:hypothetical protein
MATHDYVIDNQSAPSLRADLNSALQAIVTQNSSATAPTTTYADMIWYDSANNQIKKRNEANSAWVTLGTVDEGAGTFTPSGERAFATQAEAEAGTNTTTVMNPLRTAQAIAVLGGGQTLLGTLSPTSGNSTTLSGLTLTNYRLLQIEFDSIVVGTGSRLAFDSATGAQFTDSVSTGSSGFALISLEAGTFFSHVVTDSSSTAASATFAGTAPAGIQPYYGRCALTRSSTSVTIALVSTTRTFTSGTIRIYGMK